MAIFGLKLSPSLLRLSLAALATGKDARLSTVSFSKGVLVLNDDGTFTRPENVTFERKTDAVVKAYTGDIQKCFARIR